MYFYCSSLSVNAIWHAPAVPVFTRKNTEEKGGESNNSTIRATTFIFCTSTRYFRVFSSIFCFVTDTVAVLEIAYRKTLFAYQILLFFMKNRIQFCARTYIKRVVALQIDVYSSAALSAL